ncbi:MAG: 2-oxoacid:acceptor oxidoreductase subunit alpha [archaeon]|nr:MAG: 2-oxoacid:acceptor oxidoreductase subunit alpha [archaeon]
MTEKRKEKLFLQGNEAVVLGALQAKIGLYTGYPITPASEIMHGIARTEVPFFQAEDEIAAILSLYGASMTGAKAMTATSGPGFNLMQEGIGFGHRTEIPAVIIDVQRVGPGTGMPTRASQGDIFASCVGSAGDFFPIVFSPNSPQEAYEFTIHSFNAAEESLSPVIMLLDAYIGHGYETVMKKEIPLKTRKQFLTKTRHFTSLVAEDGIPKTTDRLAYRRVTKRLKEKQLSVAKHYNFYDYHENKKSDTLVISFGSLSRAVAAFKDKFSLFRPIRLFPIIEQLKTISKKYKKIIVAEMNEGQYATLLESFLKREVKRVPITGGEIRLAEVRKALLK